MDVIEGTKKLVKGVFSNDVIRAGKDFGKSFGDLGGNTKAGAKGLAGFFAGVTSLAVGTAKFVGGIASWFITKPLQIASGLNRNSFAGKFVGAGLLVGAAVGVYKAVQYYFGGRDQGDQNSAVQAQQQLATENQRGAMLDAYIEQASAQDMYNKQGQWAAGMQRPDPAQGKVAALSQQSAAQPAPAGAAK